MKTKKELKDEYKLHTPKMGVFKITNKSNGKILIGNSVNLDAIWNRTQAQLKFGNHPNQQLQSDWNESTADSFQFEIIDQLKDPDSNKIDINKELKDMEQLYLDELQPFGDNGYN